MEYEIKIKGIEPIIMHNGAGMLEPRSLANLEKQEITRKRESNRTVVDNERLKELECQMALYLDSTGKPYIPRAAIRACIETAARKLKQGPQVREGLRVPEIVAFDYDRERYGSTVEELGKTTQFSVLVVVQRARVVRTRAKFDDWAVTFRVDTDDELVDGDKLATWLDIAGRRIGLCDWRPEKSGEYGVFETEYIKDNRAGGWGKRG